MATVIERARAKLEALNAEHAESEKAKKKTEKALLLVIARAKAAESAKRRARRTRGLIVLGGWIMRTAPDQLAAALVLEQRKDKRRSLEFLNECIKAGDKIDD